MRILVIGSSSFVAKGVIESLLAEGHQVIRFERGEPAYKDGVLRGSLNNMAELEPLIGQVDAVINYAILKDSDIEANVSAIKGVLEFCKVAGVQRLLHFSSISVYSSREARADERSSLPEDPLSKGAYASLKVATDQYLLTQAVCPDLSIAFIRPGFVLGSGLLNPFPGMGFRLPFNRLLVFGGGTASVPIVSRDYLHKLVIKVLELPDLDSCEVFHAFDPDAPVRYEFLKTCNRELSLSNGIWRFPGWLWLGAGFCFDLLLRLIGKGPIFVRSLKNASSKQTFSSEITEARLGISEKINMTSLVRESFSLQSTQYELKQLPSLLDVKIPTDGLSVVGAGRIVGTAHVEAFKCLEWDQSKVRYYDLYQREADFGKIEKLPTEPFTGKGFWTVATPATAHIKAVPMLENCTGHCLVEKPLALDKNEWTSWKLLAQKNITVGVCHNYRFKTNVRKFRGFVEEHPTGALLGVNLLFQSPPVRGDASPWIRQERLSKSLLMDYSIHFLDLACMFQAGAWEIDSVDWIADTNGDTEIIRGRCSNKSYPLTFHLQQGFCTRTCRIEYVFRNYTAVLSFFPDSFHVRMAPDGGGVTSIAALSAWKGTVDKIAEKLSKRKADGSHAYCYADLLAKGDSSEVSMDNLEDFYNLLFDLSGRVYE